MDNISKKDIISAINQIDSSPELRKGRASSTYDLIYQNKEYPPKLVISIANKIATGEELNPNDFEGGIGTPAFNLLQQFGFEIITKNTNFYGELLKFIEQSKSGDLSVSSYAKRFMGLKVVVSFGKGVVAKIPWISFLKDGISTNNGIYPVFLYFKNENKIILSYGISEENDSTIKWPIQNLKTINTYFDENNFSKPFRYGNSFVYKVYDLDKELIKTEVEKDLIDLLEYYKNIDLSITKNKQIINYWIFQGNPKVYNMQEGLKTDSIKTWTVSSHKNNINIGDKFILWQTGINAGCYATGEVISEVTFMKEDGEEMRHYISPTPQIENTRVRIKIDHNLSDKPILWDAIKNLVAFKNFKGSNQGTNFSATKDEFETIIKLIKNQKTTQYWIYAPGEKASKWYDFYNEDIMGLGWDEIGDLSKYNNRIEIRESLIKHYGGEGSKKNDVSALDDFVNKMKIGDIIIAKKGTTTYLGYGYVSSEYYYDENANNYRSRRKVNWIKKGEWIADHKIAIKTLTDISTDSKYIENVSKLIGIEEQKMEKNQILYGPPGTGKTHRLQKEFFDKFTINESSLTKEQFLDKLVQDLNWWQVISIAVYDLKSAKVNDIFSHEFVKAKEKISDSNTVRPTIWGQLQRHTILNCPNVNVRDRSEPMYFYKDENSNWTIDEDLLNQYYPEGIELLNNIKNYRGKEGNTIKKYEFITFHQSFSYEDFIEGIKPKLDDGEKDVSFEIKEGVFKKLCREAEADLDNDYAIFIDEINRGNVSAIFGELITLIEEDKRIGGINEIKVRLPYSKSEFGVPPNLYIIGTMNTADRSVEALDTALRRRFSFTEIMPDSTLLKKIEFNGFNLAEVLDTINERIELLLDRDHTIGHSYFLKLKSGDVKGLKSVFANNIIPLLQEYFYHDYEKIALILGEGFIKIKENKNVKFAYFKNLEIPEIANQFELINSIDDIEDAIAILLNK
jgi:hypothetical protein